MQKVSIYKRGVHLTGVDNLEQSIRIHIGENGLSIDILIFKTMAVFIIETSMGRQDELNVLLLSATNR